jgi:hypothetical protein
MRAFCIGNLATVAVGTFYRRYVLDCDIWIDYNNRRLRAPESQ